MVSLIKKKNSSNKTNKKRKSNFKKTGRRTKMSNKKSLRRNRMKHGGRPPGEMNFIISTLYATISETTIYEPKVKELKDTILGGFTRKTHITAVLDMLSYELGLTGAFSGMGSGTSCTNKMFNKVKLGESQCRVDKAKLYTAIKEGVERIKNTEEDTGYSSALLTQARVFLKNFKSKYDKAIGEYEKAHESNGKPAEAKAEAEAPVKLTAEELKKKKEKWAWEQEKKGRAERAFYREESAQGDALFREQQRTGDPTYGREQQRKDKWDEMYEG